MDGKKSLLEFLTFNEKENIWKSSLHFEVFEKNLHYQGKKGGYLSLAKDWYLMQMETGWTILSFWSTIDCCYTNKLTKIMRLLILGDIVGRPGRSFLKTNLEKYRQDNLIDFVIANGENAAGGAGITAKTADEIIDSGVDAITLGDHVWDQNEF